MRLLVAAALAAIPLSPALAAPRQADDKAVAAAADTLANPATARAAGKAVSAITGAILDTRVDGVLRAVEPLRDEPDERADTPRTLRDMVATDDPDFQQRMEADTERTIGAAGHAAQAMAAALPELRATAAEFRRNLRRALDGLEQP